MLSTGRKMVMYATRLRRGEENQERDDGAKWW
jgi:hypothetical protein